MRGLKGVVLAPFEGTTHMKKLALAVLLLGVVACEPKPTPQEIAKRRGEDAAILVKQAMGSAEIAIQMQATGDFLKAFGVLGQNFGGPALSSGAGDWTQEKQEAEAQIDRAIQFAQ